MKLHTKENTIRLSHKRTGGKLNHIVNKSIQRKLSKRNKDKQNTSAESQATDTVESTSNTISNETRYQINRVAKKQYNKRKYSNLEKRNNQNFRTNEIMKQSISSLNKRSSLHSNRAVKKQNSVQTNKQIETTAKKSTIKKIKETNAKTISNTFKTLSKKTEDFILMAFTQIKSITVSSNQALIFGFISLCLLVVIIFSSFGINDSTLKDEPNFYNFDAYVYKNPYAQVNLYGQCTWFAWGRFYELYGYDPGFRGDGWNCAEQLVEAHPDKWELSDSPQIGSVFSCIERNHVGIVVGWDGVNITIQEGNLDGETNSFEDAISDWRTVTYDFDTFVDVCKGVMFAIQKINS